MREDQIDAYFLDAINPEKGQVFSLIVRYGKKEAVKRYGAGRTKELIEIVSWLVLHPTSIWQGLRDRNARDWLCYVGSPNSAIDLPTGRRIPPWPGKVFLVFANAERVVYTWGWEPSDPESPQFPEGYKTRFRRQVL